MRLPDPLSSDQPYVDKIVKGCRRSIDWGFWFPRYPVDPDSLKMVPGSNSIGCFHPRTGSDGSSTACRHCYCRSCFSAYPNYTGTLLRLLPLNKPPSKRGINLLYARLYHMLGTHSPADLVDLADYAYSSS